MIYKRTTIHITLPSSRCVQAQSVHTRATGSASGDKVKQIYKLKEKYKHFGRHWQGKYRTTLSKLKMVHNIIYLEPIQMMLMLSYSMIHSRVKSFGTIHRFDKVEKVIFRPQRVHASLALFFGRCQDSWPGQLLPFQPVQLLITIKNLFAITINFKLKHLPAVAPLEVQHSGSHRFQHLEQIGPSFCDWNPSSAS